MRTKDDILKQHVMDLRKVNSPTDIDRVQAQVLIEVFIDIRDTFRVTNKVLSSIYDHLVLDK